MRGVRSPDLSRRVFGRLTVVGRAIATGAERYPNHSARWLCVCSCGATREVPSYDLLRGRTRSCGCLCRAASANRQRERGATTIARVLAAHIPGSDPAETAQRLGIHRVTVVAALKSGHEYKPGLET